MRNKVTVKKQEIMESNPHNLLAERKLVKLKDKYYNYLDSKAKHISLKLSRKELVTNLLLDYTKELYQSAKSESRFKDKYFDVAYHPAISSELEFLIARILYHYSNIMDLSWKILLRRQQGKTAPDIRIELDEKTVAIVEIKATAGWIQTIFNKEYKKGERDDPGGTIERFRQQCKKYYKTYAIDKDNIFILLPTLAGVHRKGSKQKVEDYDTTFIRNSRLADKSLVLLSNNLSLDLSKNSNRSQYDPTNRFEKLVDKIHRLTK